MILKKTSLNISIRFKYILYILFAFILFLSGFSFQRFGVAGDIIFPYFKKKNRDLSNLFTPYHGKTLKIDIPFKDKKKLEEERNNALITNYTQSFSYVSCELIEDGKKIPSKIRLKGDGIEHLKGDKPSYRIKCKGENTIWGLKKFSIHHPARRNFINEWLFHKALKKEDFIGLRYFFAKIIINGEDLGIYAIEEHFDTQLLENNKRRDGLIIRFDEKWIWESNNDFLTFPVDKEYRSGYGDSNALQVTSFNMAKLSKDSIKIQYLIDAKNLIEKLRNEEIAISEAFDKFKLAKYFALVDLFGAFHTTLINNIRFYYNPLTMKLEPIGFDANIEDFDSYFLTFMFQSEKRHFDYLNFFKDKSFYKAYLMELNDYANSNFIENLLESFNNQIIETEKIINYEWPLKKFNSQSFYNRREYIKTILNPSRILESNLFKIEKDKIIVEINNFQKLPITNFKLIVNNSINVNPIENTIINGRLKNELINQKLLEFLIPNQLDVSFDKKNIKLFINFNILGIDKTYKYKVNTIFEKLLPADSFTLKDLSTAHFLIVDNDTKTITFKKEKITLKSDLGFPKNYRIIIRDSTMIDFLNSSRLYSQSPLICKGTEKNPITFTSSDSSSNGLLIYNTESESEFDYCSFSNFKSSKSSRKTGALTTYESKIKIKNSRFYDNETEDAFNGIRSEVEFNNLVFVNCHSDAIDLDFCIGTIKKSEFLNVGNDAIDFSGCYFNIEDINILNVQDKAISIGEESQIIGSNITISNSNIGIAAKDKSIAEFNLINLNNLKIGYSVYKKKPEFGPAFLVINNSNNVNLNKLFFLEKNSKLTINNEKINDYTDEVSLLLQNKFSN